MARLWNQVMWPSRSGGFSPFVQQMAMKSWFFFRNQYAPCAVTTIYQPTLHLYCHVLAQMVMFDDAIGNFHVISFSMFQGGSGGTCFEPTRNNA